MWTGAHSRRMNAIGEKGLCLFRSGNMRGRTSAQPSSDYPSLPKGGRSSYLRYVREMQHHAASIPEPVPLLPTIAYTYDPRGNLVSATVDGVSTNLYAYDVFGNLTNEVQNGTGKKWGQTPFFMPCCDNNGNITRYLGFSGSVPHFSFSWTMVY